MAVAPRDILRLYRNLLRAANGFTNYNFRTYAQRLVREEFRESTKLEEPTATESYQRGLQELLMVRRQASVSQLFAQPEKHAME
jgi:LYR motif-containing protein 4